MTRCWALSPQGTAAGKIVYNDNPREHKKLHPPQNCAGQQETDSKFVPTEKDGRSGMMVVRRFEFDTTDEQRRELDPMYDPSDRCTICGVEGYAHRDDLTETIYDHIFLTHWSLEAECVRFTAT